jgi:hypothetical protein
MKEGKAAPSSHLASKVPRLLTGVVLRPEPVAGKKINGGALAASDGAVHRPVVSVNSLI